MNLNLIRKYEKEFLHMLHGGKVLMGKKDPITNTTKWYPSVLNPFVETSDTTVVVIDDQYVEFRKALADGKTIEERYYTPTDHWGKHLSGFAISPKMLRIKPEEPEFKVGDWITVNGPTGTFTECISGIADDTYTLSGTNICYKSQASKWEPKEDEVCIFWNNASNTAVIAKLRYIVSTGTYRTEHSYWDNCMPFTGALPPHIKDNK